MSEQVGRRAWVLLLLAVLSACGLGQEANADVLLVAIVAPFSGDYEPLGRSVRDGVLLAAEARNQRGGVLGRQVQLVLEDTACDYTEARTAARAAIEGGASFIIGAVCANASEGVAQVATELGALQISPASVDLDLTLDADGEVRPLVFRVPFVDRDQGTVAAQFALDRLGAEKAALLFAGGSDYSVTLADAFQEAFEAGGGEVAVRETYDRSAESFFEELEEVRDTEPDLLYMPGYHNVANVLVAQARSFGLLQPIIGSDGWDAPELDREVVAGGYFTTHFLLDEPRSLLRSWVELYQSRYLAPPDALAALSYDAAELLFAAIEDAGVVDPVLVAQALAALVLEGVTGPMSFDDAHNPVKPVLVVQVAEDRLIYVGRFLPEQPEE